MSEDSIVLFPVVHCIIVRPYEVVTNFEFVNEILKCGHSNDFSYLAMTTSLWCTL